MDRHKLIFKWRYGFCELRNMPWMISLTVWSECIEKALDSSHFACGVFIDLQKAFDTVDHDIF